MKKRWLRLCSLILVIVMVANSLPLNVWAEQSQSSKTAATSNASKPESGSTVKPVKAQVMQELVDKRTQYTKEFLLDNGLTMAVVYGSAVHYENDGEWKDIDNTLKTKADGTITNTAGVWEVSFPQQIDGNKKVSIKKDGYELSFGLSGELRRQDNLEVMSTGENVQIDAQKENPVDTEAKDAPVQTTQEKEIIETEPTVPEEVLMEVVETTSAPTTEAHPEEKPF